MDFSRLRAFTVVAEELNFRRSAEILGMSQPPLTRLIAGLEKELGTRLFERTTRSVKLTAPGVLLLREAREILAALRRIETEIRVVGKLKRGNVRIGFSRTAFMARLPALLEEFQRRFPKVSLDLQEFSASEVLNAVRGGRFDLGFVEGVTASEGLASGEIGAERMGVLLPKKHPLGSRKELDLRDLKDETIILHHRREAAEFHDRISGMFRDLGQRPKIYIRGENESCPILVATGKGVSLTISGSHCIAPDQTRFVPIRDLFLPVRVFWKPEDLSAPAKSLLSFALEKRSVLPDRAECVNFTPPSVRSV